MRRISGERNERSEKGNEEERRLTERTSEESEAETKRPPINRKSHLTQNLAPGANLACGGNGLASDASFCT